MSLTGKLISQYVSKRSKQMMYVYEVNGTQAEKDAYIAAKGVNIGQPAPSGNPCFWLSEYDANGMSRIIKENIDLLITTNNTVVVNDSRAKRAYQAQVEQLMASEEAKVRATANVFRPQPIGASVRQIASQPATALPTPEQLLNQNQPVESGNEDISGAQINKAEPALVDPLNP